jgi:DNA polymerase
MAAGRANSAPLSQDGAASPLTMTPPPLSSPAPTPPPEDALAELAAGCGACRRCGLAAGRNQVVVSRGNPRARLMVIGEGPGAQEDASGRPFVGRAGQLLDQMLASVGIDSERDAYIANVVKCRPPDNRKPTTEEMAACRPWLAQQIALVDPAVILLAGATALEGVLGVKGGITRLRGQWRAGEGEGLEGRALMPILHPSYLLRNPSREQDSPKWHTWQDLKEVRRRLDGDAMT